MGYKVKFETGHEVTFDNVPTQQDVEEAEKQLGINKVSSNKPGVLDYLNPANTYDIFIGGAQENLLNNPEEAKKKYSQVKTRLQKGADQSLEDTARGIGAATADYLGGGPAMVLGAGAGLWDRLRTGSNVEGLKTGLEKMNQFMPSTMFGMNTENPAYQGMMAPVQGIMEGIETGSKGIGKVAQELGTTEQTGNEIAAGLQGGTLLGLGALGVGKGIKEGLKLKENLFPKQEPIIPKQQSTDLAIRQQLQKTYLKNLEEKVRLLKEQEDSITQHIVDGNASPELMKDAEYLHLMRIKAEHQLDDIQNKLGIKTNKGLSDIDPNASLEVKQKKYDDLKSLANNDVKLTDKQIELFDQLGYELEQAKKKQPPQQPKTYGEVFNPLDIKTLYKEFERLGFDSNAINDPLIKEWIEYMDKTRRDEKISHWSEWPKDIPDPYENPVGFSKARGYSAKEIEDFLHYKKISEDVFKKYPEDILYGIDQVLSNHIETDKSRAIDAKINQTHLDYMKNNPTETTLRPLEDVKEQEVIPEPTLPKTNVLDVFKKNQEEAPPLGNVNWDRSQEWRPDLSHYGDWEERAKREEQQALKDKQTQDELNKKEAFADYKLQKRAPFKSREELNNYLDQQIKQKSFQRDRIQSIIEHVRFDETSPDIEGRKSHLRQLIEMRDNLQKEIKEHQKAKTKSNLVKEDIVSGNYDEHGFFHEDYDINGNPIIFSKKSFEPTGAKYTRDSILKRLNGVISRYESILTQLRDNIKAYDDGQAPSGGSVFNFKGKEYGIQAAKGLEESLTNTYYKYLNNRDKLLKQQKENIVKFKETELPKIDESLIPEEIKKPTYDSVTDIMNVAEHPINTFLDNLDLFHQLKDSKIYVDKELAKDIPLVQTTINHFIKTLGLNEDQIFFIKSNKNEIQFQGNSAVIHISSEKIKETYKTSLEDSRIVKVVSKLTPETYNHFVTAKIIAHELGHFVFTKWLKNGAVTKENFISLINDFNVWLKKNKIEPYSFAHLGKRDVYQQYHSIFDEYFAERVSKNLVYGSLLDRFAKGTSTLATQMRDLVGSFKSYLQKLGINIDKKYLHDDMIQDIIQRNKELVKKTGETYWKDLETNSNNKIISDTLGNYPFADKTLSEIRRTEVIDPLTEKPIDWQRAANPQAINIGTKSLTLLGKSADWFNRNFFGKTTLSQILIRNPEVQKVHQLIRQAENIASHVANEAWFGPVTFSQFKDRPIFQRFSKIKNPDSPYMVIHDLTNQEAFNLHNIFQQGYEQGLTHEQSLKQLGQHLTDKEQKAYKVFGNMFTELWKNLFYEQEQLGKKDLITFKPGYYPVMRRGDYFITITHEGELLHREHFATHAAAESAKERFEHEDIHPFIISDVQSIKDQPQHPGVFEMIDIANNWLEKDRGIDESASFDRLKQKLAERGGKLGQHQEERFNTPGYKGSEIGLTPEELGQRFKEGIQDYIKEVTSQLRNLIIKTNLDPFLETNLKIHSPDSYIAGKQMRDSAMNVIPNKVEAFDKGVYETVDKIARFFVDDFHPNQPVYKTIQHTLLSSFYLLKVLPSLAMAVSQILSPIQAIRHGAYDGGLRSIKNFGKGFYNFLSGDHDTMKALFYVSQTTDIIEPQFINTLHLMEGSKISEFIKDWVLMRKPQEATDILSRAITFSYLYTHYKDLGQSKDIARSNALNGTTATMAGYSSGETAPVFKNLGGIIGESARPLQTYGQTQLGNLIADIKYLKDKPTELKSWAPLVIYGITSTILGGVVTGPIMSQYETIRLLLMKLNPLYHLPSILDLLYKMPNMLESITEDKDAQTKLLGYGALNAGTNIDLGASSRVTETLPTNILTVMLAMLEGQDAAKMVEKSMGRLFPVQSSLYGMAHGGVVLGAKALGANTHDSDLRTAIDEASPRGTISYGLKELAGVNTTKVMGQRTNMIATGKDQKALMERGPMELTSGYLGNMSAQQKLNTDKGLQNQREEQIIKDEIKNLYDMYNQNPQSKYLDQLIKLGAVDSNIKSALETRTVNALLPQDIRFITDKKGSVPNTPTEARKVNRIFNFGR